MNNWVFLLQSQNYVSTGLNTLHQSEIDRNAKKEKKQRKLIEKWDRLPHNIQKIKRTHSVTEAMPPIHFSGGRKSLILVQ